MSQQFACTRDGWLPKNPSLMFGFASFGGVNCCWLCHCKLADADPQLWRQVEESESKAIFCRSKDMLELAIEVLEIALHLAGKL